jgi:RNA polymerase sigma-70 factor (ECF subfamily)
VSVNWAEIYTTTWDDLVRFLYRKVWDADRAQDLAQEAFVRALRHEPDNPRAWLFTVAGNLATDEARTAIRRRRHLTLIRIEEEARRTGTGAETADEEEERMRGVQQALERLTDRDREALLLWDAGLSYSEIAVHTGLSPGAVGTTLARARRRLVDEYHALEDRDVAHR